MLRLFNKRVSFANLRGVLLAFVFGVNNVRVRALVQVAQLFFTLTVKFNPALVCGDLTLESLRFRADVRDFDVDLIERPPLLRQLVFAAFNFCAARLF